MIVATGITVSGMLARVVFADFTRVVVSVGISLSVGVIVPVTIEVVATEVVSKLVAVTTEVVATEVLVKDTSKVLNVVIGLCFEVTVGVIAVVANDEVITIEVSDVISVTFV